MNMFNSELTAEDFNRRISGYLPGTLGVTILTSEPGRLTGYMDVTQAHMAPNGFLHAASVVALADTCCGVACKANLPKGAESFTTIELKCNFMSTVKGGRVLCAAVSRHLGAMTQVWDAVVTAEDTGRELAAFRCTQMVLWPADERVPGC